MRLGRHKRCVLQWSGLVVCLLIVITWAESLVHTIGWRRTAFVLDDVIVREKSFYLSSGAVSLTWQQYGRVLDSGWEIHDGDGSIVWLPSWGATECVVPLWIPFLLLAVSTVSVWWLDRRRIPPGRCGHCGYNLTGNVSGRCPECGQPIRNQHPSGGS